MLVNYEYDGENNDRLSKINYSNGQSVTYTYDDNNITGVSYDEGITKAVEYEYTDGTLTKIIDNKSGLITIYSSIGTEIWSTEDNSLLYSLTYNDDGGETENLFGSEIVYTYSGEHNQVTGKTVSKKSFAKNSVYEENDDAYDVTFNANTEITKDWFDRIENKNISVDTIKTNANTKETSEYHVSGEYSFTYDDTEDTASTKILSHSSNFISEEYSNSRTDNYEYDETGNITGVFRYVDGVKTYYYTYKYDEAGQLMRENILEDDKTILYVYDIGGNTVSKTEYAYTLGEITENMKPLTTSEFSYDDAEWKDLLTGFTYTDTKSSSNSIDTAITYDEMGNVTYFDGVTYTWTAGRQLESTSDGTNTYIYSYNEKGYLTKIDKYENGKKLNGFIYVWDGDKLVGRGVTGVATGGEEGFVFSRILYDTDGEAYGFSIESIHTNLIADNIFLYRKNLQGDITAIINSNGEIVLEFTYDAYGNASGHTSYPGIGGAIAAAIICLFTPNTYRGYAYSPISNGTCYYLGSRFYSPQLGRFLNADSHIDTGTGVNGTNMFAYCNNNPVIDPTGEATTSIQSFLNKLTSFIKSISKLLSIFSGASGTNSNNAVWPMSNLYNHRITSRWGYRLYDKNHHHGIDIRADNKTPVLAVTDGKVVEIDRNHLTSQGNYIVLEHSMNGVTFYTRYMHLYSIQSSLKTGTKVAMGEQIALSGTTAQGEHTVDPHLHFQIQFENTNSRSQTVNPYNKYHFDDKRVNKDNPNPFFIVENEKFIFNKSFDPSLSKKYLENNDWSVSTATSYKGW